MDFNTSDLCQAATYLVHGAKLSNITVEGRKGTFCLTDVNDEIHQKFILGNTLVEPIAFHGMTRWLSSRVVLLVNKG